MRFKIKYLLIVFTLTCCLALKAEQDQDEQPKAIEAWDNSAVDLRQPSADTIQYYQQLPEYQYKINRQAKSYWYKFLVWLRDLFRGGSYFFSWFVWLLLALAVFALLAIIIRLFGIPIKGLFVFSRSTKVTELSFSSGQTDLENEKLEDLLNKFCNSGAYREATRVLFLLTLRQMNRSKMIQWHAWKTDREYYYEIVDANYKEQYLTIMKKYEYIWYGKFIPEENYFNELKQQFEQFTAKVALHKI